MLNQQGTSTTINTMKVLQMPQAIEVEEALLGTLLLYKESFHKISNLIRSEVFYTEKHGIIFNAIKALIAQSKHADILTVSNYLKTNGDLEKIGGILYLTTLTDRVVIAVGIEDYAKIIYEKYLEREMISICDEFAKKAFSGGSDVFDLYSDLSSKLLRISDITSEKQARIISDLWSEQLRELEKPIDNNLSGITTGFRELDDITNGWQPASLIVIAARPGMGKTAFVLNLARNAAVEGNAGVIFSLEMSAAELTKRLIASESEIKLERIQGRNLNAADFGVMSSRNELINSKLFIDDNPHLTIQLLRSKAISLARKHSIKWIVVDYLQLLHGDKNKAGNREQEISSISRGLKSLAKELNIPVLALSQLSRAVESRPAHLRQPVLSDLRESGAIEQDADQVIFLFRPEYYGIMEDDEGNSCVGLCKVIFGKNRNGTKDAALISFNGSIMKFIDYEAHSNTETNNGPFYI